MDILRFCNETRKVTFVSVGSTTFEELELINITMNNIVIMASEIEYPCKDPALEQIALLKRWFKDVGYSDHTTSFDRVPFLAAKIYRADYYEKHLNPFGYTDTADAGHSINADQFRKMVKVLRDSKVSSYWDCPVERPTKRVVIATSDIKKGDSFTTTNIGCFRLYHPELYIDHDKQAAHKFDYMLGKKASKSYLKGDPI
jgi:sialic acid synthase SpsE